MAIYKRSGDPGTDRKRKRAALLGVVFMVLAIICAVIAFTAGGGGGNGDDENDQVRIVIDYSGSWTGTLGDLSAFHTVDGTGHMTYTLDRPENTIWSVSAVMQKSDDSAAVMTVSIVDMDGHVLKTASTSTAYGMAQVAMTIE